MNLHDKSCLLDAFACVLGVPATVIADFIGHPGSNGFHTQELIEYCLQKGYAVTPIERFPTAKTMDGSFWEVLFPGGNNKRFGRHMLGTIGVLTGFNREGNPHAIAWCHEIGYDSAVGAFYHILKDGEPDDENFKPRIFWRLDG